MRAIRRAAPAVLLGAAALALTVQPAPAAADRPDAAPPGHAHGGFQAHVTPTVIAPGGRVMLIASGCRGDTTVSSGVFETVTLHPHSGASTAVVRGDARHGAEYQVKFACADGPLRTVGLTITGGHHQDGPPRHGVQAGVGGSLGGFDLQQLAAGGLLLAGAFGLAFRRARRHSATGTKAPGAPAPARHRTTP